MTPAEKILWEEIRVNKLGVHFPPSVLRTSPPNTTMEIWAENEGFESSDLGETPRLAFSCKRGIIHPCSSAALVIEVDGDVHDLQKEDDERREKVLSPTGMLRDPRWG